ncbi:MAG TPA: hypothetical protein VEA16_09765, partial [Vicinamibacterales bacterium]|nr:hypothetical protein [Vicinamibacterales bacterium]
MIEIITGRDAEVAEWASSRLGQPIVPPFVAIGFAKDGELDGAAVLNDYNGANVELTIYGPGCLTPATIKYVF